MTKPTPTPAAPAADRPITLQRVASLLGCSVATVSRLRAGDRQPSFLLMAHVEAKLDWPIEEQARARSEHRWHLEFETALRTYYATPEANDHVAH